jgi:hypothetical protein
MTAFDAVRRAQRSRRGGVQSGFQQALLGLEGGQEHRKAKRSGGEGDEAKNVLHRRLLG